MLRDATNVSAVNKLISFTNYGLFACTLLGINICSEIEIPAWILARDFQYYGKHYEQLHDTAMGSPVSVVVAKIVMQSIEERAHAT